MTAQNIVIFGEGFVLMMNWGMGDRWSGVCRNIPKTLLLFQKVVFEIQKNRFIYYDSIAKKLSEK